MSFKEYLEEAYRNRIEVFLDADDEEMEDFRHDTYRTYSMTNDQIKEVVREVDELLTRKEKEFKLRSETLWTMLRLGMEKHYF